MCVYLCLFLCLSVSVYVSTSVSVCLCVSVHISISVSPWSFSPWDLFTCSSLLFSHLLCTTFPCTISPNLSPFFHLNPPLVFLLVDPSAQTSQSSPLCGPSVDFLLSPSFPSSTRQRERKSFKSLHTPRTTLIYSNCRVRLGG